MKRCTTCQETYSDETLKFCRVDGVLLVDDATLTDDASATRILPGSQTGEAQAAHAGEPPVTNLALDVGAQSKTQTRELKGTRAASKVDLLGGIKQHKIAALIVLTVIAAGIFSITYLRAH